MAGEGRLPTSSSATVAGGYSPLQTFVRRLAAPSGAHGVKLGTRIVLSWHPDLAAKQYQVDVSTTNGFSTTLDTHRVDGTTWAPDIDFTQTNNQGTLYWRVAAVDQGSNAGKFASGSFSPARPAAHCTSAKSKPRHQKATACVAKPQTVQAQEVATTAHRGLALGTGAGGGRSTGSGFRLPDG